jgi:5'-nucleotidase
MRILLTNDDGILAPGLTELYRAVADLGQVDVVAPETSQSAVGHAISVLTPLVVQRVHVAETFRGYSVDGRPADCVKLGVLELLDSRPDFVISGINSGINTSINVLYSGTVAGAVEAAFFGIPAMACSLELSKELDFRRAAQIVRRLFEHFAASRPGPGTCLNVNIPALDAGWPRGVRVCAQDTVPMRDHYHKHTDPLGRAMYWLDGVMPESPNANSDLLAIRDRCVAVTPLRFDMTDHASIARVNEWRWPDSFG